MTTQDGVQQDSNATASRTEAHGSAGLVVGALGIVYGDIGTSPLYTLKLCLEGTGAAHTNPSSILGILSLIFWMLTIVVTLKYVAVILRSDNRGEGGILALLALVDMQQPRRKRFVKIAFYAGLLGASLFLADSAITPAISVLSAVEGLEIATPVFKPLVLPISIVVLVALFAIQRHGTGRVGALFGPIIFVWFLVIGALGVISIVKTPEVLFALDPRRGLQFLVSHGWQGFFIMGSVVLAVTGAEALYADMGHFGRRAIQIGWLGLVFPSLTLNYFGQGALVLRTPEALENPFYHLAPDWGVLPLVLLATMATIIASQAVISGAFSLAQQASLLGFVPRLQILHTSEKAHGQIYVPRVNWLMFAAVILLVATFHTSGALAGAYGVAVTGAMTTTTVLAFILYLNRRAKPAIHPIYIFLPFLIVDVMLFGASLTKLGGGGFVPLAMGMSLFLCMTTWYFCRGEVAKSQRASLVPLRGFVENIAKSSIPRVGGTAVFLSADDDLAPRALLHNMKHNKVLHGRVVLLTIRTENMPHVLLSQRVTVEELGNGFYRVVGRFGFMDEPDLLGILRQAEPLGLPITPMETSFFLGRQTFVPGARPKFARWREALFIMLSRTALNASDYFHLPTDRVVELGTQVEI